jgi:hypothetical protein
MAKEISPDALAIRWSLRANHVGLKKAAFEAVKHALERCGGNLTATSEWLEIRDPKTLKNLLDENPDLAEVRRVAKARERGVKAQVENAAAKIATKIATSATYGLESPRGDSKKKSKPKRHDRRARAAR